MTKALKIINKDTKNTIINGELSMSNGITINTIGTASIGEPSKSIIRFVKEM
jgi:hypothetical protein